MVPERQRGRQRGGLGVATLRLLALCSFTACGGAAKPSAFPPPVPEAETRATLAGHRCTAGKCTCRAIGRADDQVEQSPPEAPAKRFELRLGSSDGPAWVVVDGKQVLYKGTEHAEDCYYLDLGPGKHDVTVQAHAGENAPGVGIGLDIHEHASVGTSTWWYDTFAMHCGLPAACDKETLASFIDEVRAYRHHFRDACGSTKVGNIQWTTGQAADTQHPESLAVGFVLEVMPALPKRAPGSPECGRPAQGGAAK